MWGPVQREAAAAAKAAEAHGPQTQPTSPRPVAAQPSAPAYGRAHGLPMQHGQGGGKLHLGNLAAALLGITAGVASAVARPVLRGGGGRGMGGGGGGRGRR